MDLVLAAKKISKCIASATTKEHHKAIERMIENVENWCFYNCPWNKLIKSTLDSLYHQNINKSKINLDIKNI
jgi:hypothetical protein